jgi:4-diphosphocytidyl-2-C-methyl-D-erythritol kinase
MRVRAFAKINLALRIVGTRPDGYHELRTVFQSIALHDTLTITPTRRRFEFSCDHADCPSDENNLVWRAAAAMWDAAHRRGALRGVSIHLAKQIPMQAGLGGGSSDAAAVIRVLGRLWHVPEAEQRRIAAALGADVPYFLVGGTALGIDRGDRIEPLPDRRAAWVVLVLQRFGVSTGAAFGWWDMDHRAGRRTRRRAAGEFVVANDLERPVARRHPEIARLVRILTRRGAGHAAMTGSGSTVFGLFSRQNAALDAASSLFLAGHRTIVTRTVGRKSYQSQLAAK